MTEGLTLEERRERAERRVQRFVARFEPGYYELVCHAALPLVLTPELVSYLRHQFLRGVPWMAEVDLLLSDLCSQVGYELYAMDVDVRAYVLRQGSETFTAERMRDVANLLISYVGYLAKNSQLSDRELETQQWAAMVYLGPAEKKKVVKQIADRFQATMKRGVQVGSELLSRAEMARLAQVTETLREQLVDYQELVDYASLVSDVQRSRRQLEAERVEKTYVVAPGKFLRLPSVMQQELIANNRIQIGQPNSVGITEAVTYRMPQSLTSNSPELDTPERPDAELPKFQTLEFVTAQIVDLDEKEEDGGVVWPPLQQEMVIVAEIVRASVADTVAMGLEPFEYQTGQLEKQKSPDGILSRFLPQRSDNVAWVIKRQRRQGYQQIESLGNGLTLEMVSLQGGTFIMGSQKTESDRVSSEGPRHRVSVPGFWLGKYPVTQAQWRFVATLPQVDIEIWPEPSHFKGDNRPVERVSWYEAQEFCARLSVYTERQYRLPTEAEWEYACRARTETPFCFGQTIGTNFANYNGKFVYGDGPTGLYRGQTMPVDSFKIANGFGLYDMHGNAWEWCMDHWHDNYVGAPTDGRAWLSKNKQASRVLRGGSWLGNPGYCRAASRDFELPDDRQYTITFRVSCTPV